MSDEREMHERFDELMFEERFARDKGELERAAMFREIARRLMQKKLDRVLGVGMAAFWNGYQRERRSL